MAGVNKASDDAKQMHILASTKKTESHESAGISRKTRIAKAIRKLGTATRSTAGSPSRPARTR
jgi:hypothetical protein